MNVDLNQPFLPKQILWSIYDPLLPAPQPTRMSAILSCALHILNIALNYAPRFIQKYMWSWISRSSVPAPKKDLLIGDLSAMCKVGMFRFLLDKVAQESKLQSRSWIDIRIANMTMSIPLESRSVRNILSNKKFSRGAVYDRLVYFFGYGIFTSRIYDRWQKQRKVAIQLLKPSALKSISQKMFKLLLAEGERTAEEAQGEPIDLVLLLSRMGLFAFCSSILGIEVHDIADDLAPAVNQVLNYINGALDPIILPFDKAYHSFLQQRNIVHDWMRELILRVRENSREGQVLDNPLVQKIVEMNHSSEEEALIELMISMVLGGHETVSRLMLGALYALLKHPEYIERIRIETQNFIEHEEKNERNWESTLNAASIPTMDLVINESLRLFPPVWLVGRTPSEDVEIEGKIIPKGTEVLISFLIINRLERNWGDDAEIFNPDRFKDYYPRDHFFPFAIGAENCPGNHFARLEATLLIVGLLHKFDLSLADPDQMPDPTSAGTFRLFKTLGVIFKLRSNL